MTSSSDMSNAIACFLLWHFFCDDTFQASFFWPQFHCRNQAGLQKWAKQHATKKSQWIPENDGSCKKGITFWNILGIFFFECEKLHQRGILAWDSKYLKYLRYRLCFGAFSLFFLQPPRPVGSSTSRSRHWFSSSKVILAKDFTFNLMIMDAGEALWKAMSEVEAYLWTFDDLWVINRCYV